MAISTGAIGRTIGTWLSGNHAAEKQADSQPIQAKPMQAKGASALSIGWGALDEEERQQVRKAGADLIKFQSIQRGY